MEDDGAVVPVAASNVDLEALGSELARVRHDWAHDEAGELFSAW